MPDEKKIDPKELEKLKNIQPPPEQTKWRAMPKLPDPEPIKQNDDKPKTVPPKEDKK